MAKLVFVLIVLFCAQAFAAPVGQPAAAKKNPSVWTTIKAGAHIQVTKYDQKADLFEVKVAKEEAVGPLWVTNEALSAALSRSGHLSAHDISGIVNNQFTIDKPLPVLTHQAVQKRKGKSH